MPEKKDSKEPSLDEQSRAHHDQAEQIRAIQAKNKGKIMGRIDFDYSLSFIFPLEDAVSIVSAFAQAQRVDNQDYNNPRLVPVDSAKGPSLRIISSEEYNKMLLIDLLNPRPNPD